LVDGRRNGEFLEFLRDGEFARLHVSADLADELRGVDQAGAAYLDLEAARGAVGVVLARGDLLADHHEKSAGHFLESFVFWVCRWAMRLLISSTDWSTAKRARGVTGTGWRGSFFAKPSGGFTKGTHLEASVE